MHPLDAHAVLRQAGVGCLQLPNKERYTQRNNKAASTRKNFAAIRPAPIREKAAGRQVRNMHVHVNLKRHSNPL